MKDFKLELLTPLGKCPGGLAAAPLLHSASWFIVSKPLWLGAVMASTSHADAAEEEMGLVLAVRGAFPPAQVVQGVGESVALGVIYIHVLL